MLKFKYFIFFILYIYILLPNYIISINNLNNQNEEDCFKVTLYEENGEEKSEITYKAGETINLILEYKVDNDSCIVYQNFTLLINNSTEHDDFYIKITDFQGISDNNMEIELRFNKSGEYQLQINYHGKILNNYSGINLITITPNDCVGNNPEVDILPIDKRDFFFVGENINMRIKCKDLYGNYIINKGNENFNSLIYDSFKNEIPNTINFQRDVINNSQLFYYNNFKIYEPGNYNIFIYLNSSLYKSFNLSINDNKCKQNEFQCLNKLCFENLAELYECNEKFLYNIEIDKSYICNDSSLIKEGKVFRCSENGDCVKDLNECECSNGYSKCNGQCLKDEQNYCINNIPNYCNNKSLTLCPDGSCITEKECDFKTTCPFGFKSCGMKCIFYNETCSEENNCGNDLVLCWDLTCAISYDKCPSRIKCKKNEFLCPDGTCTNIENNCSIPIERQCLDENYPFMCNDGKCVSSLENCKKNIVCPKGKYLCENNQCLENCSKLKECKEYKCDNGLCVKNFFLCSNDIFCPNSYVKCEQGGCAKTIQECDYIQGNKLITCPLDYDILCPDLSCVKSFEDCISKTPECPPSFPYLCWNNECRKNISECPTQITCPSSKPVLCNDGTCQKSKYYCKIQKNDHLAEKKCNKNQYRCYDGSCVNSLRFCPSYSTCGRPEENIIKCWNGGCSNNIESCPEIPEDICLNSTNYPYFCPDGTCRESSSSCSSISTCPDENPIKCYDNSCRDSLSSCPKFYECSENTFPCPDGTCASNIDECNTIVTCPSSTPFLCFDGTCQKNLKDCPKPPECGNNFMCPSGECVNHRQNCKNINSCTKTVPVKCESNVCHENIKACESISLECPSGYIKCLNGECKIKESLCEEYICPPNKPHKCIEGTCVLNSNYCNKENGCPYFYPFKCKDGTCLKNEEECEINSHQSFECPIESPIKCPDGSCQSSNEECPLQNGCTILKPIKCADGSCINPNSEECPKPKCGYSNPFKCPNGFCVSDSADCALSVKSDDIKDCGENSNLVMCNDGFCVPSYDYCLPQIYCENGYSLCPDGTCRVSVDACPIGNNCPPQRPVRCPLNVCVEKEEDCDSLICPKNYKRCFYTGECLTYDEECKSYFENGCQNYNENGTKIETKRLYRCSDGRCLENEKQCYEYSIACYNDKDNKYYLSNEGECVGSLSEILSDNKNCQEGKIKCPDGHCVDKQSNLDEVCFNEIGCPLIKPYRCSNNECVSSFNECPVHQLCDISKPYLCGDGSCVSNYEFCNVLFPCDENKERCALNKYCVDKDKKNDLCKSIVNLCPQASPIKCPNGACVKDILSCAETQNKPTCNDDEFFCETLHKCLSDKIDCIGEERVLNMNNYNNNYNNGCPSSSPNICFDGTCVSDIKLCPTLPSCKTGKYRCENGICVDSLEECNNLLKSYSCPTGQTKCIDGICRNDCSEVKYLGCNVNEYHCSNGMCVKDILECIGYSMCDNIYSPFRCMDGSTCVNDINNCENIYRQGRIYPINYSFNIYNSIDIDFIFDLNNKIIGNLHFDGNSLKLKDSNDINYGILKITQISDNFIKNNENLYNTSSSFMFNISNAIPHSDGRLTYENSILSAIFNLSSESIQNDFNLPGLLTIKHNYYISDGLLPEDYCLAKLKNSLDINAENNQWICVERQKTLEQTTYKINSFGIYAVILNPIRALEKIDSKNFYVEHFQGIFLSILITITIGGIIFYILSRLIRFREKYKETQKKIKMLRLLQIEYERMTTDVFGQTLGDNILGLVYTKNPIFMLNENDIKNNDTKLEEEVELLIKKCKKLEGQNNNIQKNINEINEKYNLLKFEIDTINDS